MRREQIVRGAKKRNAIIEGKRIVERVTALQPPFRARRVSYEALPKTVAEIAARRMAFHSIHFQPTYPPVCRCSFRRDTEN